MTTFTSALDKRIKASVISGYLSTLADALGERGCGNTCGSQFAFGLRSIGDISDVAGLIAPRPCMIQIGRKDTCFIPEDSLRAFKHLRKIYAAAGAKAALTLDLFDGGHEINLLPAVQFFKDQLATTRRS